MDKGPIPPHSAEAEAGLIGSIMLAPDETLDLCRQRGLTAKRAKPSDPARVPQFYVPAHESIYLTLLEMADKSQHIDLITVTAVLRQKNMLETVGGPSALATFTTMVPTAAAADHYIDIIHANFLRRQLISFGTDMVRRAYHDAEAEADILDEAQAAVTGLSEQTSAVQPVRHIAGDVDEALKRAEAIHKTRGKNVIRGLGTGFHHLDRQTGGFIGGQLIIFAGRPGAGKTVLGLNIAEHVMFIQKTPVLLFSCEMTRESLIGRLFIQRADSDDTFPAKWKQTGMFSDYEIEVLIPRIGGELRDAPLFLDATPGLRVPDFKARSRRFKAKHDIGLIIVDYLQLMRSPSKRAQDNKQIEVAEICAALKEIAKELNVPVIALAQLNRQTEGRGTGEPRLMDLRESGAIENDADFVGLIHQRFHYTKQPEDEGKAKIIIAKHRDGPRGDVDLVFLDKKLRFENQYLDDGTAMPQYSNDPKKRQHYEEGAGDD
jgi:replicative DNA helicase